MVPSRPNRVIERCRRKMRCGGSAGRKNCCMKLAGPLLIALLLAAGPVANGMPASFTGERRSLELEWDGRWNGFGVSFSPYRDGQSPETQTYPSVEEIRADLHLIRPYWRLLRGYDSTVVAERMLELIRAEKLPFRLMLGVWIAPEPDEAARAANRREVENGIRLANAFPEIVAAVIVGNETCVFWSFHPVGVDTLIPFVREVRAAVRQPVTVADDLVFWNTPESRKLAAEIDFITLHYYALWRSRQLDDRSGASVVLKCEHLQRVGALLVEHDQDASAGRHAAAGVQSQLLVLPHDPAVLDVDAQRDARPFPRPAAADGHAPQPIDHRT